MVHFMFISLVPLYLLLCIRSNPYITVCLHVLVCHSYVLEVLFVRTWLWSLVCYFCVLVWCFSHDRRRPSERKTFGFSRTYDVSMTQKNKLAMNFLVFPSVKFSNDGRVVIYFSFSCPLFYKKIYSH